MEIPASLRWLERYPDAAIWLEALPRIVDEVSEMWGLEVGAAYEGSNVSFVAPASQAGEPVVLKVQWPHRECEHEAEALRVWAGEGAIELLAHDPVRDALLLERCDPGTHLAAEDASVAVEAMVGLLPLLWKPAGAPFVSVVVEAARWESSLVAGWEASGRACDRGLVDAAAEYLRELPTSQGEQVLVHQDLHGDNVLATQRTPWLVIDPKPVVGEREFSAAPILRSFEFGHSRQAVVGRLDRLCGELGLDRERTKGWAVAQTVAWSWESPYSARHHETAAWLLEA